MWLIRKRFPFEAAHRLPYHDGKCSDLHGHSYVCTVSVLSSQLETDGPKRGMVMDFADIKDLMKPILDTYLDHKYLNDTLCMVSPTAECIAKWVYEQLKATGKIPELYSVSISETCTSEAIYFERPAFNLVIESQ